MLHMLNVNVSFRTLGYAYFEVY